MSSNIILKRICQYCGKEFEARTTKTRYCSKICNSKDYKAKIKLSKIETSNIETKAIKSSVSESISEKEFLSIKDVCSLIGISRRTIYRLIEKKDLPTSKIGRRTIIKRSDLDYLINGKPVTPTIDLIPPKKPKQYSIKECISLTEVRERFGISESGLYDLIKKNNIPKTQKGKEIYIPIGIIVNIFNK